MFIINGYSIMYKKEYLVNHVIILLIRDINVTAVGEIVHVRNVL